uniref:Small ribosomal subunit protein uS11c n=2 Tax=Caulerpa TaxID=76312 RepID=A0A3G2SD78_9CHLO|nr:ribosomal protein S11 [Caulerpa cupressoides]QHN60172.1 30S ribosomal protein S11 [Caulerpa sertularioides f. longipes]
MCISDSDILFIYIRAPLNNTGIILTNFRGNVLNWVTAGSCGFKGARKATPFAAQTVVDMFRTKTIDPREKCREIHLYISGIGPGRETALRGLKKLEKITVIRDITPLPHNGCRPPKKRRT